MNTKRILRKEEFTIIKELSQKQSLISDRAYSQADKTDKTVNKEDIETLEKILETVIDGFSKFSSFLSDGSIRIQYNYNYDNTTASFIGVGYLKLEDITPTCINGFIEADKDTRQIIYGEPLLTYRGVSVMLQDEACYAYIHDNIIVAQRAGFDEDTAKLIIDDYLDSTTVYTSTALHAYERMQDAYTNGLRWKSKFIIINH